MSVGYSGTPLPRKLGLKDGDTGAFIGLPDSQLALLDAREYVRIDLAQDPRELSANYNFIHMFTKSGAAVTAALPLLQDKIKANGMIWMSWPKKASKVATDVTEDVIRNAALKLKLVDVKVCAVDEIGSGLKLVIRKELRP